MRYPEDIRAIAVCGHCGTKSFTIFVFKDSALQIQCRKCGQIWEAPDRGRGQDTGGDQTVGEAGDESSDMVSPSEGEEGWQPAMTIPFNQTVEVMTVKGLIRDARRNWDGTDRKGHVHCWRQDRAGDLMAVAWRDKA